MLSTRVHGQGRNMPKTIETKAVKPKQVALSVHNCQDCCDDTMSKVQKGARDAFNLIKQYINNFAGDGNVQALAVPGRVTAVPIRIPLAPIPIPGVEQVVPDQEMRDAIRKHFEQYSTAWDLEFSRGYNSGNDFIQISARGTPAELYASMVDGVFDGFTKQNTKTKNQCRDCCMSKRWKQSHKAKLWTGPHRSRRH